MRILRTSLAALALALAVTPMAHGHGPGCFRGPCYYRGGWGYRPYYGYGFPLALGVGLGVGVGLAAAATPVYVAAPPVIVTAPPAVVYAPPAPSAAPLAAPPAVPAPANNQPPVLHAPAPVPPADPTPAVYNAAPNRLAGLDNAWSDLSSSDQRLRAAAIMTLARQKDRRAVRPLRQALREDRSPAVREAAARGLGLIGAPIALPALQEAAGADDDRDVRRSAAFSAEIIRANLGGR
jgi:hypothetical protein